MDEKDKSKQSLSRRDVVVGAVAIGFAGSGAAHGETPAPGDKHDVAGGAWYREVDIVCVGTGAAGLTAAVTAQSNGDIVLVLERRPVLGGTTAKSAGVHWMPNNRLLRQKNIPDERSDAIAFMARLSFQSSLCTSIPHSASHKRTTTCWPRTTITALR